jgi:hypothetical protein
MTCTADARTDCTAVRDHIRSRRTAFEICCMSRDLDTLPEGNRLALGNAFGEFDRLGSIRKPRNRVLLSGRTLGVGEVDVREVNSFGLAERHDRNGAHRPRRPRRPPGTRRWAPRICRSRASERQ